MYYKQTTTNCPNCGSEHGSKWSLFGIPVIACPRAPSGLSFAPPTRMTVNHQRGLSFQSKAQIVAHYLVRREFENRHPAPIRYDCGTPEFAEAVMTELRRIAARLPEAFRLDGTAVTND